ncbi:MAG: (Fe-S)-binding protein [Candidatus Izemoplasmatales bacterium]|jgi:electron transport complex protein RnfB|nr:(Fe-S)-binding protein [Candidatus Izemoplasmatales bacterium]
MEIVYAAMVLGGLGFVLGFLINLVGKYFHVEEDPHINEVVELLPRVNCGACGYPGCKEMAIALLENKVKPAQCKPIKKEALGVLEAYLKDYFSNKNQA